MSYTSEDFTLLGLSSENWILLSEHCDCWHRRVDSKTINHVGAPRAVCTANHASRVSDPDVVRDPRHGSFSLKRGMIVSHDK